MDGQSLKPATFGRVLAWTGPTNASPRDYSPFDSTRALAPILLGEEVDDLLISDFDSYLRKPLEDAIPGWTSICPYRVGYLSYETETGDTSPALCITVQPNSMSEDDANKVLQEVHKILVKHDPRLKDVAIEVAENIIAPAQAGPISEDLFRPPVMENNFFDVYTKSPVAGASIRAAASATPSGSLGCLLRVYVDGVVTYMALVSHHVVSDEKTPIIDPSEDLIVSCPSADDHLHWMKQLVLLKRRHMQDPEALKEILSRWKHLQSFDRKLGKVVCSSGLRQDSQGWIMDWALVELFSERFPTPANLSNSPSQNDRILCDMLLRAWHEYRYLSDLDFDDSEPEDSKHFWENLFKRPPAPHERYIKNIQGECRRESAMKVFKKGRTTGMTMSICNGIQPSVKIGYEAITVPGKALSILRRLHKTFGDFGDSGATVVDYHGRVVGLVLGLNKLESQGAQEGTVYVTPMEAVLSDVEKTLRGLFAGKHIHVELP